MLHLNHFVAEKFRSKSISNFLAGSSSFGWASPVGEILRRSNFVAGNKCRFFFRTQFVIGKLAPAIDRIRFSTVAHQMLEEDGLKESLEARRSRLIQKWTTQKRRPFGVHQTSSNETCQNRAHLPYQTMTGGKFIKIWKIWKYFKTKRASSMKNYPLQKWSLYKAPKEAN